MFELKLNQLQHYADARNAMMVPASCCEPAFMTSEHWILFTSSYYSYVLYEPYWTAAQLQELQNGYGNFEVDHFKCINKQTYMYTQREI